MSADREQDHLDNMSGMNGSWHWNQPYCYADAEDTTERRTARLSLWAQSRNAIAAQDAPREELSQAELLERPKCAVIGAEERVAQLAASAMATLSVSTREGIR